MDIGKHYKLSSKCCEPYKVIKKINDAAYKLELPERIAVHPVFHISRLKERLGDDDSLVCE